MLQSFFQNNLDQQVMSWFLFHRNDLGIKIFTVISFFGNWQILVPAMIAVLLFLYFKNRKKFIIPFALTVIGA